MVQTGGGRLLISIGGVPAEGVEGGADLLDRVAPRIVTVTVGDVARTVKEQAGVPQTI